MRYTTLVLSVTLFYSLSFVYAIPHEVDEQRHRLHRRQDPAGSSSLSNPAAAGPSSSKDPQGSSSPVVSPSAASNGLSQSSGPSSLSSVPSPTSTLGQSSDLSSPSTSTSSGSTLTSSSSTSSPTNTGSHTSLTSTPTTTNNQGNQNPSSNHHFSSTVSIPNDTQTADGNTETGGGSGSSFLKNKAAMGSTFAIVGLIAAAIIFGAAFSLIKRIRQRRQQDEFETYFEKFPASRSNNTNNRDISGGNEYGLGPSATDLTSPTSTQAFMSRDVHFGSSNQFPNQPANYSGFEYPPDRGSVVERPASYVPGTAYAAAMSQRGQYRYEGQVEDPNAVPNHPFADPNIRRY